MRQDYSPCFCWKPQNVSYFVGGKISFKLYFLSISYIFSIIAFILLLYFFIYFVAGCIFISLLYVHLIHFIHFNIISHNLMKRNSLEWTCHDVTPYREKKTILGKVITLRTLWKKLLLRSLRKRGKDIKI